MIGIYRSSFLSAALLIPLVVAVESRGQLSLQVNSNTGFVQLVNDPTFSTGPVSFDFYDIKSDTGSLNPGGWQSLASQGYPGWTQLGASDESLLGEANLTSSTVLALGQSLSLGAAYRGLSGFQDLTFQFGVVGAGLFDGPVVYAGGPPPGLPGDYNADGLVSHADYSVMGDLWGQDAPMANRDPSLSGPIGAADFQVYRANYGSAVALATLGGEVTTNTISYSVTSSETLNGTTEWIVRFHDVLGALASHINFQVERGNILSINGGNAFLDDSAPPLGVPGTNFLNVVDEGVWMNQDRAFAALGTTLGAPFSSTLRQFVRIVTPGTAPNALIIQGEYGYQGTNFLIDERVASAPGTTQDDPVLPNSTLPGQFIFEGVPSGTWVDPPVVDTFEYVMDSASLFTAILDFPTGFADSFLVFADGTLLGDFGPGDSVDFESLLGHGVDRFTIANITPLVDAADPNAFPLKLEFSTPTASFRMLAVPEPGTLALTVLGLACTLLRWRQNDENIPTS